MRIELMLLLACLATSATAADVYKWTDAGGVVHYADTEPPAEMQAERLPHITGMTSSATTAAATADVPDAGASKPAAGTLMTAAAAAQERCASARADLELLQSGGPVGLNTAGSGKPAALDEAGRTAQIAGAQAVIARNCK